MRLYTISGQKVFTATQEILAEMLGVHRNAVSHVASEMQTKNIISYSRGRVEIIDIDRLHRMSCECYDAIIAYRRIIERD
jgi:Mn-dependent DtxR family transcriptional regulator